MDDLVAFLRARLDERAAKLRRLIASESADEYLDEEEYSGGRDGWGEFGEVASEVANFHEMLAEVDAKRRIIDWCSHLLAQDQLPVCTKSGMVIAGLLALPYADHTDYCAAWRP